MIADRRVKIVATIGPSTQSPELIREAIRAGMNVARLNFSHGDHEFHREIINNIRQASAELRAPVGILADLQGPKVRVGQFQDGSIELVAGEIVEISSNFKEGKERIIPVDFSGLAESCKPGTRILMDDGLMELVVEEVLGDVVKAKVIDGGTLRNRKGVNVPGALLPIDCLTEKDLKDLTFALENRVDYIALSFVRRNEDIRRLREIADRTLPEVKLVAKIEMLEALTDLEKIIQVSDAVMVARGDLAVEVGQTMLPGHQKRIISLCNEMSCPVITATQMLESMIKNPRPTRAEITDVANAVLDGSDALMLSGESAMGKHPFKCIRTMSDISREVEKSTGLYYRVTPHVEQFSSVADSIAASACLTAKKIKAAAIVCLSTSGKTAVMISSYRPMAKIIAVTHVPETAHRLELAWGIQTLIIDSYNHSDQAIEKTEKMLLQMGLVKVGDEVIITLGMPVSENAKTNSLRVLTITNESVKAVSKDRLPLRFQAELN